MSSVEEKPKPTKSKGKRKKTSVRGDWLSAPASPHSRISSGNPVTTGWFKSAFTLDDVVKTVDTNGRSELKYPVLSLQNMYVSLQSHIAITFDEFQVRNIKIFMGPVNKQFYNAEWTSFVHSCTDLDTTLVAPVQMLDNRSNSKRMPMCYVATRPVAIADFRPVIMQDVGGAANIDAMYMDKTWISCTTGKNAEWQGFIYYFSWNVDTKPSDPAHPPKFQLFIEADMRYRGVI